MEELKRKIQITSEGNRGSEDGKVESARCGPDRAKKKFERFFFSNATRGIVQTMPTTIDRNHRDIFDTNMSFASELS